MLNLILGIVIGTVFSQLILRLFNIGWKKLEGQINNLDKKE
jgi:hypothetical protein